MEMEFLLLITKENNVHSQVQSTIQILLLSAVVGANMYVNNDYKY